MEAAAVLTLWLFNTDIMCQHLGDPYTVVGCSDQGYGNPNIYIAVRAGVGVFTFCYKTAGYVFKRSLFLHTKEAVHQDSEGG